MISIVCPVYNGLEYTKKCLKSLSSTVEYCSFKKDISIIFVDDGSTDGTGNWINNNYPEVIILKGNGNLWWSGAMNVGAKYALAHKAQYVLLINNDNIFEMDYLEKLINFAKNRNFKIVGSKIMDIANNSTWSLGGYFNKNTGKFGMYKSVPEAEKPYFPVDWLPGMGTLIHRSVFEDIGYWDEKKFPQYYSDADFILRAKEKGIIAYVYPEIMIWDDLSNTGIIHNGNFLKLIRSLFSIRSNNNILISSKFIIAHSNNPFGIFNFLINKYGRYFGGYAKHKIYNLFRIRH